MNRKHRAISAAFGGKLHVNKPLQVYVIRTMLMLPEEVISHITRDCWFLGSVDDAWAYTFRGDELVNKHLIVLSDRLLKQPEEEIIYTIAHEIGHVVLGHRNSILVRQSPWEIDLQEKEADEFAKKHILTKLNEV